jgi:hypothetical protein
VHVVSFSVIGVACESLEDGRAAPHTQDILRTRSVTDYPFISSHAVDLELVRHRHSGRRARVGGDTKVGADFGVPAAAVNLARPATLGVTHHAGGWAASTS